jgi:hypothetical protein
LGFGYFSFQGLQDAQLDLALWLRRIVETWILIATAVIVGLGTGLGAIVFRWFIDAFTHISVNMMRNWLSFMGQLT